MQFFHSCHYSRTKKLLSGQMQQVLALILNPVLITIFSWRSGGAGEQRSRGGKDK